MSAPFPANSKSLDELAQTMAALSMHDDLTADERLACSEALDVLSWLDQAGERESVECVDCGSTQILLAGDCRCDAEGA